jgi:hypothetical protein
MDDWFTDSELQRISEFASTPAYERSPEMLLPEADD